MPPWLRARGRALQRLRPWRVPRRPPPNHLPALLSRGARLPTTCQPCLPTTCQPRGQLPGRPREPCLQALPWQRLHRQPQPDLAAGLPVPSRLCLELHQLCRVPAWLSAQQCHQAQPVRPLPHQTAPGHPRPARVQDVRRQRVEQNAFSSLDS